MNATETARAAVGAIKARRSRTALTVLGIVIGITAVMLTVGLGIGAQKAVTDEVTKLGSNLLVVSPGSVTTVSGVRAGEGTAATLTLADATVLADKSVAPDVEAVAPASYTRKVMAVGDTNWSASVVGTTPSYMSVRSRAMASGRFFDQTDYDGASRVVVLGASTAQELFGDASPLERTITVDGTSYTVVGVLARMGLAFGGHQDDMALVPLTTYAQTVVPGAASMVGSIYVTAVDESRLSAAYQEVHNALLTNHGVTADDADFAVDTLQSVLETAGSITSTLTALLGGIAAFSLLVGGIGVMNIMLVSVSERTREIGLRKALGATPHDIQMQFLTEASLLGLTGGALGLALGVVSAQLLTPLIGVEVVISWPVAAMALVVSLIVGVVAGVYPARRAARLSPIDALRIE
ncbi:MAG: ABC transporter permease [Dermatophilus congolensis]|nr:ABC transporter permease [Dermatophilus congolensis]